MRQQGKINREDMLELTRRMNLSRNCFSRIAGAYFDKDGFIDGTFNKHFGRLTPSEQRANLEIAKVVPFSETNVELKEYVFEESDRKPNSIWKLLMALKECGLKDDGLLEVLYEFIGERYQSDTDYCFYAFYGSYDVPIKAKDKENLRDSEEVYSFLIGVICPVSGDYEPGEPVSGFLFPAFRDRSSDPYRLEVFWHSGDDLLKIFE